MKKIIKNSASKDVDSYIASAPKETKPLLLQIRDVIQKFAPEAQENISYQMPGYKLDGKPLFYFAYFKNHIGLYALSGTFFDAYKKDLANYETAKGTIRFPLDKPLPLTLIKKLIQEKVKLIKKVTKGK